jgi:recombination protein RecT
MSRNRNVPARAEEKRAVARQNKADLQGLLESVDTKAALERVLPKYLTVERLIGLTMLATTTSPQLRNCTPGSVIQALMQAAQLGLEPNGPLGHAYLVPYGTVCTMIPGYRGLFFLAVDSGAITKGVARLIYEGDDFEWTQGVEERIDHRPSLSSDRSDGRVIGAYAVVWHPDGSTQFEVMNRQEIDRVRASSKASKSGPWVDWYGEMAKKTVVKRLLKQIAISTKSQRLAEAIELDNRFESGEIRGVMPGFDSPESLNAATADRTRARTEELKERMAAARGREVARVEEAEEAPPPETADEHWPEPDGAPGFADDEDDQPPY